MATVPANLVGMDTPTALAAIKVAGLRALNILASNAQGGAMDGGILSPLTITSVKPTGGTVVSDDTFVILNFGRGLS
jgi:hypothetical protein